MPTAVHQPSSKKRDVRGARRAKPPAPEASSSKPNPASGAVRSLARQLHSWTGSLLGGVGTAADMSLALAAASVQRPGPKAAVTKASALLKDAREAAGLTLDDLGAALEL